MTPTFARRKFDETESIKLSCIEFVPIFRMFEKLS